MEFRLSDEEARFQREVREWLARNLPPGWGSPGYRKPEDPADKVAFMRGWYRKLYDGGWAGLHWPREYGGRGGTPVEQVLFLQGDPPPGAPPLIHLRGGPGAGRPAPPPPRNRGPEGALLP